MPSLVSIDKIKDLLMKEGLYAMVIPSTDPHFNEYTPEHYRLLEMLSGFSGSAGTLIVTLGQSALWTDSRYFQQAEKQLEGSGIDLMRMKMPGVPQTGEWLLSVCPDNAVVGIDGDLFSIAEYEKMFSELCGGKGKKLELRVTKDIFEGIEGRPAVEFRPVEEMPLEIAGEDPASKRRRLFGLLRSKGAADTDGKRLCYFTQSCDEIAWLSNLRGRDIEYNPVFLSYAIVFEDSMDLFVNEDSFSGQARAAAESNNIRLHPYGSLCGFISSNCGDCLVAASFSSLSVNKYRYFEKYASGVLPDPLACGCAAMLKSIKNPIEIEGFRRANMNDGVAWIKFLKYVDQNHFSGKIDEYGLSLKLQEIRKEVSPDYVGESFAPIVAFGQNAALPHYEPEKESPSVVGHNNFLLIDAGAHYKYGTTDVTRTLCIGEVPYEWRKDYALTLKGMIRLSMAVFKSGTTGAQLDILARGPICSAAKIYMHGTGHGIGHYLNVHEGPQSIRMEYNPVPLEAGMVTSNEPSVYVPGSYGIRIENTILCRDYAKDSTADYLSFETLNYVPIEYGFVRDILSEILSAEEMKWLEDYNKSVCLMLEPMLSSEEAEWMRNKYSITED